MNKKSTDKESFALAKENYILLIIGFAIIVLGFILMIGGKSEDPTVFNEEEIFSFRRITLAPMVVTADRPNSSILLGSDLDLFQAESVADLAGLVPGLYVVTTDSRGYGDVISMRGSTNTLFFSPAAVGIVIDDVPMGAVFSYPTGLLDLEEVKVLRGPQGTIYGRNGAAGMIDMTTRLPGEVLEA